MPRASHRAVDDEPISQRPAIVGAVSADREHVGPAPHEQHSLLRHMADQLAAVGQFGESNALREIGSDRLGLVFSHRALLPPRFFAALHDA